MRLKYDFAIHRLDEDQTPVFYVKHLLHWRGWRIDLHKMVAPDQDACYHTHPANAIRIILYGGYVEEVYDRDAPKIFRTHRNWWIPGMIGRVRPELCHRIHALFGHVSYSLWLRAPIMHNVTFFGRGWGQMEGSHRIAID